MRFSVKFYLMFLIFAMPFFLLGQSNKLNQNLIKEYKYSHDLDLPDWGPYSKKYNGISHITSKKKGYRFDLSVAVGFFHRSKMIIPDVEREGNYYIWDVDPDLKYLGYNYQLEWKDKVKCDVVFSEIDDKSRFISLSYTNNTSTQQDVVHNLLASMNYPQKKTGKGSQPVLPIAVTMPIQGVWIDGMDYSQMDYATPRIDDHLIYDAFAKGEIYGSGMVNARALGKDFGKNKGDKAVYQLKNKATEKGEIVFRYKTKGGDITLKAKGVLSENIVFKNTESFQLKRVKINSKNLHQTTLILESLGGSSIILDGFAIIKQNDFENLKFEQEQFSPSPQILEGPTSNSKLLKYKNTQLYYGIVWEGLEHYTVEIQSDRLNKLSAYNNRNIDVGKHVENDKGHFTDILVYGIELLPYAKKELNAMVCVGSKLDVEERLRNFKDKKNKYKKKKEALYNSLFSTKSNSKYEFSMRRMESVLANNIVFPVICQNEYIKHYTPGRRWNSLYTWDVGMIGIGMLEMDLNKSMNILNTYTNAPENPNAFVHHGTPVPTQIYQYLEIWNKTNNIEFLKHYYPRLKKYYQFLAGTYGSSITRMKSGLIKTWDYFYNSGGWDDYPPQRWVEKNDPENRITPVISSVHVIRSAKILQKAAIELGIIDDIKMYNDDIKTISKALQKKSWDKASGYFSYVRHTNKGEAIGILRSKDGTNMNMGMDGASPILAGVCTDKQRKVIVEKLLDKTRLWTKLGISVDQKAPHAKVNAYVNETVWISHQWFFWKTLLDLGLGQEAWELANTALRVFSNETERTYHCWEHYTQKSELGSGWHQFSGLNAPLVNWYHSYFKPGNIYGGFDFWIQSQSMNANYSEAEIHFQIQDLHRSKFKNVLVSLNKNYEYQVFLNGKKIAHKRITDTTLQIAIPSKKKDNQLRVEKVGSL